MLQLQTYRSILDDNVVKQQFHCSNNVPQYEHYMLLRLKIPPMSHAMMSIRYVSVNEQIEDNDSAAARCWEEEVKGSM